MALMRDLSDIREEIFRNNDPKRVVVRGRTKNLDAQDYRASANSIVSEISPEWESDSRILFLVIDVWSERTFLVIDVNNHDYDFHTAHKTNTILPVYVLRQHGKRRGWVLVRWLREDERLTTELADLHDVNGFDVPTPFLQDHNTRIVYANPRWLAVSSDSAAAAIDSSDGNVEIL